MSDYNVPYDIEFGDQVVIAAMRDAQRRRARRRGQVVPSSPAQLALPSEPPPDPDPDPEGAPTRAQLRAWIPYVNVAMAEGLDRHPRSAELMLAMEREEGPMTRAERLDAARILLPSDDAPTSPISVVRSNDEPPPAPARPPPPPPIPPHLSHLSHARELGYRSGLFKQMPSFPGQPLPVLPERAPEERPEPRPALDLGVCAVCQEEDAPKEVVFQGCAHVSTCVACSWELVKIHNHGALGVDARCPVCRTVSMPMRLRVA